ncbi:MAG: hypothetical protein INR65_11765 [Gluconacetobacter diazotrophicus]|nr:hypothetical protein [Gluconacetobacter diazotrophicus]
MLLGITLAVCAQGALYLGLRHASVASLPAWAHGLHRSGPAPWPSLVTVDVVPPAKPPHPAAPPSPPPPPP